MIRIAHAVRRRLAIALASVPFHRIELAAIDGQQCVIKSRSPMASLLVPLGNLYLRWQRSDARMLSRQDWYLREVAIGSARIENGRLITPFYPGESLRCHLSSDQSSEQKLHLFELALQALRSLHQRQSDWKGDRIAISHGDATSSNVIVDKETESAVWIDFDTCHRNNLVALRAQSDDLRALLYSSASCLPPETYPRLTEIFLGIVPPDLLADIGQLIRERPRPNTFELAQAPLSYETHQEFTRQLMDAINASTS